MSTSSSSVTADSSLPTGSKRPLMRDPSVRAVGCRQVIFLIFLLHATILVAEQVNVSQVDPWPGLELITGRVYSAPSGQPRNLNLFIDRRGWKKAADISSLWRALEAGDFVLGSHILVLVDRALGESEAGKIVWFGVPSLAAGGPDPRAMYDAQVVWVPSPGRLLIVIMDSITADVEFTVYEVAFEGEEVPAFTLQLSLAAELPHLSQAPRPLARHRMLISDWHIRDQLQVVVESDALVLVASRKDGKSPEVWVRLDLKSLTWSDLKVEQDPEKHKVGKN